MQLQVSGQGHQNAVQIFNLDGGDNPGRLVIYRQQAEADTVGAKLDFANLSKSPGETENSLRRNVLRRKAILYK